MCFEVSKLFIASCAQCHANAKCFLEKIFSVIVSCCTLICRDYQFGSLLLDGSYAGTILSYHPILNYSAYVTYDKTLEDTCCTAGLCHEFLKLRPPQNCSGYVAPKWGKQVYNRDLKIAVYTANVEWIVTSPV